MHGIGDGSSDKSGWNGDRKDEVVTFDEHGGK